MASHYLLLYLLLVLNFFLARLICASHVSEKASSSMFTFPCSSSRIKTCNASLYHINNGISEEQVASFYSINTSQLKPISNYGRRQVDFLITVPCSCEEVNGTTGYFYDTYYLVQPNDTFYDVSARVYSGQAWTVGGEGNDFNASVPHLMHLLCGCVENEDQIVVTYTVQNQDTLSGIASLLSAEIGGIQKMNTMLTQNPAYIDVGWVLFVPMEKNGIPKKGRRRIRHEWIIVIGILSAVTLLSIITLIIILLGRKKSRRNIEEDPKAASRSWSYSNRAFSLQKQLHKEHIEDVTGFESERPVIFNLDEIEKTTNNFDDSKIIGRGGYGCVYHGVLGDQEVAIKKMRSNKSKEFFAELKVLCKIHHINVVELLGYASGDDHLYLVYEFVRNGSLSDHLHDPLLKGHPPLTWPARTQIALDAAKGIEYIHDHTKARYVHRDIKTSNILLDVGLRAKVADFGLAKLVERSSEEEMIATRLVGTPGYLPPESVKELQVTAKTDVFAFGVVLAELITGQRALSRDNREPTKMKSLITVVHRIFKDEEPETALEEVIDGNLRGSYPLEDVYKMAEVAEWCLSEDAINRPEMRDIVVTLSQIVMSSTEWEASLGGNSQVFSGVFNGR
ncbi:hypothetical protein JRO89_XS05G0091100 [Xanthoceras sorbifolium]|uniref:LysM domain receptor-like kinase 3 n=1 Tax=Xanthoceras sorbifolium TaxID=99658 RepID=A0ABQ8I148_9ROSI|nr:hypothetical protein JRO89_XS05G0091100 [Xanthoceras sorbifolium]